MAVVNPEQYASRVEAALLRELRRTGRHDLRSMPTPEQAARLILETREPPAGNPMADRVGPVWSGARTRQALGLRTRQALASRRANGTVLGLPTREGNVYYPLFQFRRRGGAVDVHPHLVPVLKTLKDIDPWTVAAMLRATDPDLGMSAAEWAVSERDQSALRAWAGAARRELSP